MISRLLVGGARLTAGRMAIRQIRSTAAVMGGHGHDHHEPIPPHIPRPERRERNIFGEPKAGRISSDDHYMPGKSDILSFVGALAGVLLTIVAIKCYTFKHIEEDKKKHAKQHGHDKEKHGEKECCHKEAPKAEVRPVVEKKLVVDVPKESEAVPVVAETLPAPEEPAPAKEEPKADEKESAAQAPADAAPGPSGEEAEAPAADGETTPASKIPDSVPYLLIGGGTASYYAALVIRARDPNARVLIVTSEKHLPYNRPALSKELWWYGTNRTREHLEYKAPTGRTRDVFFEAEGFFVPPMELPKTEHGGVSIVRGVRVQRIDAVARKAYLENGAVIAFEKCLLAPGTETKRLPELDKDEKVKQRVLYLKSIDEFRRMDKACASAKRITIVGGGFLASELAHSIKRKYPEMEVNQVFREVGPLAVVLPEYFARYANGEMRKFGVNVYSRATIKDVKATKSGVALTVESGSTTKTIESDYVIAEGATEVSSDCAKASGFKLDENNGGIVADAKMRVRESVYAAGDAVSFEDAILGRMRHDHWENAQITGRLAGENMTGGEKAFWYQPSYFTKISPKIMINGIGDTDSRHETVSLYAKTEDNENYDRGVIFYTSPKSGKIVGVVLVNLFGPSVDVARRIIDDQHPIKDFKQLAKLFPLFENEAEKDEKEEGKEKLKAA